MLFRSKALTEKVLSSHPLKCIVRGQLCNRWSDILYLLAFPIHTIFQKIECVASFASVRHHIWVRWGSIVIPSDCFEWEYQKMDGCSVLHKIEKINFNQLRSWVGAGTRLLSTAAPSPSMTRVSMSGLNPFYIFIYILYIFLYFIYIFYIFLYILYILFYVWE